jgi:hypothetical protein
VTNDSEFNLQKWIDADLEPYADMQLSQCDRRAIAGRAFHKALDLVMEEIRKETDPESWGSFALPTVERIISKLRGER